MKKENIERINRDTRGYKDGVSPMCPRFEHTVNGEQINIDELSSLIAHCEKFNISHHVSYARMVNSTMVFTTYPVEDAHKCLVADGKIMFYYSDVVGTPEHDEVQRRAEIDAKATAAIAKVEMRIRQRQFNEKLLDLIEIGNRIGVDVVQPLQPVEGPIPHRSRRR